MTDDHRLPPHNLEAQRACLGTFLDAGNELTYNPIAVISAIVQPRHFFGDDDRTIYTAAMELRDMGREPSAIAVGTRLDAFGKLTPSIKDRIQQCCAGQLYTKSAHVEGFAREVLNAWKRRTMLEILQRADLDGRDMVGDPAAWGAALATVIADVAAGGAPKPAPPKPLTFPERVTSAIAVMRRRSTGEEWATPTPWGSVNLAMRGGFWPGLYTLTSASGMGKTQWAIECALHAAETYARAALEASRPGAPVVPDRVAYIALELGDVDLVARFLGLMAANEPERLICEGKPEYQARAEMRDAGLEGLRWSDLFFGVDPHTAAPAPARRRVLEEVTRRFSERLAALPIHVETADAIGWSYRNLQEIVREQRPRLVVLDYSQLVAAPPETREELRQTIGNVAKVARDLARQPGGPAILALSSTARANYGSVDGTDGKAPGLGHGADPSRLIGLGKESGELEFTADAVLALAREPIPENIAKDPDPAARRAFLRERSTWLAIAKGRGFPPGWVEMIFDGSRFSEKLDPRIAPAAQEERITEDWRNPIAPGQ